jgi:hypothetical protein
MINEKIVKNHPDYKIDIIFLEQLIDESIRFNSNSLSFFQKSYEFYRDVQDRSVDSLSSAQLNWLWELSCVLEDRKQSKLQQKELEEEERKKQELEFLKMAQEILAKEKEKQSMIFVLFQKIVLFFRK